MRFARQLLTLVVPFVVFTGVLLMASRYRVVGVLLSLAGAGGIVWGAWYVLAALSPGNRSNELKEIAVVFGIAAILGGGLLVMTGVLTGTIAAKRKAARTSPKQSLKSAAEREDASASRRRVPPTPRLR